MTLGVTRIKYNKTYLKAETLQGKTVPKIFTKSVCVGTLDIEL